MEALNWIVRHSSDIAAIGGLLLTASAIRAAAKAQRIANLLAITENHREIWNDFSQRPELGRVLDPSPDLKNAPPTRAEKEFVTIVILHLSSVYESLKDDLITRQKGIRRDVRATLSLPIPRAVFEEIKVFQNDDFVAFVESCLSGT